MTDRSKSRIFKLIELDTIRDLKSGDTVQAHDLIKRYVRIINPLQQISTPTPTTFEFGEVREIKGMTDNGDNSITIDHTSVYTFTVITAGSATTSITLHAWIETTIDDAVSWTAVPDTLAVISAKNNELTQASLTSTLTLDKGFRFRFRHSTDSGSVTLGSAVFDTGVGIIEQPSLIFSIHQI
jgi:hypothetical protein